MRQLSLQEYTSHFGDGSEALLEGQKLFLAEREDYLLPRRKRDSHKYSYGRALLIAGSAGFSGAPVLAANACERSGAGLTQLLVPESIYPIAASRCDGAVVRPLPALDAGGFSEEAIAELLPILEKADSCVIGPGLGLSRDVGKLVRTVVREASCSLVLDADALTLCAETPELLRQAKAPLVLTPHGGEFKRLGGDLSRGRLAGALAFGKDYPRCILVLKGYGTLICHGAEVVVNPSGSPAMAKGGSGDVLSGVLGAFLAQGFDALFSARCAVYLHGRAGDLACAELGEYSVTPSDLIRFLPKAFRELEQGKAEPAGTELYQI